MPDDLDLVELELIEIEATLLADDHASGMVPPDASRARFPHEVRAQVNFATLDHDVGRLSGVISRRMLEDRRRYADLIEADLSEIAAGYQGRIGADAVAARVAEYSSPALNAAAELGAAGLIAESANFYRGILNRAADAGAAQAVEEAVSQGITQPIGSPDLAVGTDLIDRHANRLALEPFQRAIAEASQAPFRQPFEVLNQQEAIAATRAAVEGLSSGIEEADARSAAQQATSKGRQAGAGAVPLTPRIYASELLDPNTCGPCSLIDGHQYANETEAAADYPAGTYLNCEGGERCRGTLVYVWDEAPATVQA